MASQAYRNMVLAYIDRVRNTAVFLEVASLEALWAEPFEDRGITNVATGTGFEVDIGTVHEWALRQQIGAGRKLAIIWNTGRCGSTLMHRALCAAGVASLSEPFWFEQLNPIREGPRDDEDEAEVQTAFACQVVAWTVTLRLYPSAKVLALNPKGFG